MSVSRMSSINTETQVTELGINSNENRTTSVISSIPTAEAGPITYAGCVAGM